MEQAGLLDRLACALLYLEGCYSQSGILESRRPKLTPLLVQRKEEAHAKILAAHAHRLCRTSVGVWALRAW